MYETVLIFRKIYIRNRMSIPFPKVNIVVIIITDYMAESLILYEYVQRIVMPAWTTAVRVRSSLYWRRLNAYCMSIVRLVLCPRVTIVLAEQQVRTRAPGATV